MKNRLWILVSLALSATFSHAQTFNREHAIQRLTTPYSVVDAADQYHRATLDGTALSLSVFGELDAPDTSALDQGPFAKSLSAVEITGESNSFLSYVTVLKGEKQLSGTMMRQLATQSLQELMFLDRAKLNHRTSGHFGGNPAQHDSASFSQGGYQVVVDIITATTPDGLISITCMHLKGDSVADNEVAGFLSGIKYKGAGFLEAN